jgi:L-alanine-DL-glutamate epimerase-like enolase superfamily enzyme
LRDIFCEFMRAGYAAGGHVRLILTSFLLLSISAAPVLADERPVTEQEQAKLAEALKAQGCSAGKMKVDDGKFEVDDAMCADGKKYELVFDSDFRLIKKEVDD